MPPSARHTLSLALSIALLAGVGVQTGCGPRAAATAKSPRGLIGAAAAEAATLEHPEDDETDPDDASADVSGEAGSREVDADDALSDDGPCAADMAVVHADHLAFCIDRYEASLVEILEDGSERPYPHNQPVDGHVVRAVSAPDVFPQGFINELEAEEACAISGKRLCSHAEWKTACMGPARTTFPYGNDRRPGACHDTGKSAVVAVFGADAVAASHVAPQVRERRASSEKRKRRADQRSRRPGHERASQNRRVKSTVHGPRRIAHESAKVSRVRPAPNASGLETASHPGVWAKLNEPALGQVDGALAKTGSHAACVNDYGVYDMVGNIHEWVRGQEGAAHGTFAGGYYLDTALNGDGCQYQTRAHARDYHDYSTGFRCCSDLSEGDDAAKAGEAPR